MIDFTREIAIKVVKISLRSVADFKDSADITIFTFKNFLDYHKSTFIHSLKVNVLNIKGDDYYFDVPLTPEDINNWETVNDCIDYLLKYTERYSGKTARLKL